MRRALGASATFVVLSALAGCGDDDAAPPDATDVAEAADDPAVTTGSPAPETGGGLEGTQGPAEGTDPAERVVRAEDGILSDGRWAVGDAGTVEFRVTDAGLELVEVVAASGWSATVDEDSFDEIEVEFRRGDQEYEIEVEYDDGVLEVEIDLRIAGAEPGPFAIGSAGTATLDADRGGVSLVDLVVADGWTVTEQDTSEREVEIELRRGGVTWQLAAEVDDGRLEVDDRLRDQGRYP
jgi:hypothetical protein